MLRYAVCGVRPAVLPLCVELAPAVAAQHSTAVNTNFERIYFQIIRIKAPLDAHLSLYRWLNAARTRGSLALAAVSTDGLA